MRKFAPAVLCMLMGCCMLASPGKCQSDFPLFLRRGFDYARFMRFDADAPPKEGIYQSNGFLALVESGFGGQVINVPAASGDAPDVHSDALSAIRWDAPVLLNASGQTFRFDDSPGARYVSYYPDRTVYDVSFAGGPTVSLLVYPVYGVPAAVFHLHCEKAEGSIKVTWPVHEDGFQAVSRASPAGDSTPRGDRVEETAGYKGTELRPCRGRI
jgi:hypothetical protein